MRLNSGPAACYSTINTQEAGGDSKKSCLESESRQSQTRWTNVPPKPNSEDSAQPRKFSREKGKESRLIAEIGDQIDSHPPLRAGWLTPCERDLSLDAILLTQSIWEITEGEARGEIWSPVNHLFFIFTSLIYRRSQQVRQGIA